MPGLTKAEAQDIIRYNINRVYHLPVKYKSIRHYLRPDWNIRKMLLRIYNYLKGKDIQINYTIIHSGQYLFFMDNTRLTRVVRGKNYDYSTSYRYMSILCAMGFFTKQKQTKIDINTLIGVNYNFLEGNPHRQRPVNVYAINKLTAAELDRINRRAEKMIDAGVNIGNISFNKLMTSGLNDIAHEVFPVNNPSAPELKQVEFEAMQVCIDRLIESQGYASKSQIHDNLSGSMSDTEIDKLFRIFKEQLRSAYNYKSPTKKQKQDFGLSDSKYIFTAKD